MLCRIKLSVRLSLELWFWLERALRRGIFLLEIDIGGCIPLQVLLELGGGAGRVYCGGCINLA